MQAQGQGNRLRELREARGLKPYELSVLIHASEAKVSRMERGLSPISDEDKATLAKFFGVTRAYLMGWDEETIAA